VPARSPQEVDELFTAAMNSGDLESALALFEEDGSFATEQGEVVSGKDALRQVLGGFFAMQPQLDLQIEKVILAGDIAVNYGTWTLKAAGPEGPREMSGRGVAVVRQQPDGAWLYVVDDPWADRVA
jgi:uncharacterized protein (TIGR02246 family)